jgi:hypothetical protein
MIPKKIFIDSSNGGNGDIWMRLVSFYTIAALLPEFKFCIRVPSFFYTIASHTFKDRIEIVNSPINNKTFLEYSNLGFKDIILPIIKGKRFISPYHRSVIYDRKEKKIKDIFNIVLFTILDWFALVQVPNYKCITLYQGYLDIIGIKTISNINYEKYVYQLKEDSTILLEKLNHHLPISPDLILPHDLKESILIFPTGTSRQFIPVWWAYKNLPDAYYCFFIKDEYAKEFQNLGLKTIYFHQEPGDIIYLSQNAKWTISTDSFPSHLIQYSNYQSTIVLTEVLKSRIISPAYRGKVVDSEASCHPCLHLARKTSPKCSAGYSECLNWTNLKYCNNILNSLPKN